MPFILRNDVIYTQPARLCAIQTIAAKSTRYHTMISDVFMFMLFLWLFLSGVGALGK